MKKAMALAVIIAASACGRQAVPANNDVAEAPYSHCAPNLVAASENALLTSGDCVVSENQGFALIMQPRGDLELIDSDGQVRWNSGTGGSLTSGSRHLGVQVDGNAVIYEGETPVWATGTSGENDVYTLAVTDLGVVELRSDERGVIWSAP